MTLKLVSENEEPVEPAPSWNVIIEAGQGTYAQHVISGYPSFAGPLFSIFNSEDEEVAIPIFMCPYHRIVRVLPDSMAAQQELNPVVN